MGPQRVYFLDEVTTGLDSATAHQVASVLRDLAHLESVRARLPHGSPGFQKQALALRIVWAVITALLGALLDCLSATRPQAIGQGWKQGCPPECVARAQRPTSRVTVEAQHGLAGHGPFACGEAWQVDRPVLRRRRCWPRCSSPRRRRLRCSTT